MSEPTTETIEPRPKNLWDLPIFGTMWAADSYDVERDY